MTEMFGEAWSPMSVPDLAPDDDDTHIYFYLSEIIVQNAKLIFIASVTTTTVMLSNLL